MSLAPECDVAILGGGPAGAAAAITLARAGHSVAVLEQSQYDRPRVGETLPPAARVTLARLAVWEPFVAAGHAPSPGILSAWGNDAVFESHCIFNPYGHGWHLDRQRFDAMLAGAARHAGAQLLCGVEGMSCVPHASDNSIHRWQIAFGDGRERRHLQAAFVIDATGRTASFARRRGARRLASDRLVGLPVVLGAERLRDEHDGRTLVEASEDGWWYSALLPGSRFVVVYMTDADLLPERRDGWPGFWRARLQRTIHTKDRLRESSLSSAEPPSVGVMAAGSSRLDRMSGHGWLAVGDAALAFDPLSSEGILQALISGGSAGEALHRCLAGDTAAIGEHDGRARQALREYVRLRAIYYGRERRWPRSIFWRRRHAAPAREETRTPAPHFTAHRQPDDRLTQRSST